jgi:hypothetical protein
VLRAFQHYGLVLADNGSDWFFSGTTDDWWGTAAGSQVISELKTIPAAQFDAIDESGLQAAAGSYAASGTPTPCATATMSAAPSSPRPVGTPVTFTGGATACPNPRFQFWMLAPGSSAWTVAQAYSANNTFNWTTTGLAGGTYHFSLWVRDAASAGTSCNSLGCDDAFVPGTAYTLGTTPCASVTASATPPSPQAPGTAVTFTAIASGCASPLYQFWMLAPGSSAWTVAQAYSGLATFGWVTTGKPAGSYHFSVWARDSGSVGTSCNSLGCNDAFVPGFTYTITGACTSATASAVPASTAARGTTVAFTAIASGCPTPLYQFWVLAPGGTWTIAQAYSNSATFNWTTTGKAAGTYYVSVWVRDASSSGTSCNSLGCNDAFVPGFAYTLT